MFAVQIYVMVGEIYSYLKAWDSMLSFSHHEFL